MRTAYYPVVVDLDKTAYVATLVDFDETIQVVDSAHIYPRSAARIAEIIERRRDAAEPPPDPTPMVNVRRPIKPFLLFAVPITFSRTYVRVNLTFEPNLLRLVDEVCHRRGMSRSAFIARAAAELVAA